LLNEHYDLLLTDCHMPQMNGYELATAWRRHEREQGLAHRLPIIAMTANVMQEDIVACREAGMDDYLAKPVQIRVLEQAIERWMPPKPAPVTVADDFPPELRDVRNEMLAMLIATCNEDLPALRQAAIDGDPGTAFKRLHRVLGTLPMFTDSPLVARGRGILDALRGTSAMAALPGAARFADDLDELLEALSREVSGR
jgi:DNA-binding LytR/AlgR family response regulator